MKDFHRGTAIFGILMGILFVAVGALVMAIGFWKTLLLLVLFAAGYFAGAVGDPSGALKKTINRLVPEKKNEVIHFREELAKEQEAAQRRDPVGERNQKEEDGE